jgi:PAS domain S-box-containing protein
LFLGEHEGMSESHQPPDPFNSMVKRLIETDHSGRVLYATPEAAELFGSTRREIVGKDLFRLFGADSDALRAHLRAVLIARRPVRTITATLSTNDAKTVVFVGAEPADARTVRWRITTQPVR